MCLDLNDKRNLDSQNIHSSPSRPLTVIRTRHVYTQSLHYGLTSAQFRYGTARGEEALLGGGEERCVQTTSCHAFSKY